eukprot:gene7605-9107_t
MQVSLKLQKRSAGTVVGKRKIWIDPNESSEVSGSNSRQNVRKLIKDGFIVAKPMVIFSKSRHQRLMAAKAKGRHTGFGKRKGTANAKKINKELKHNLDINSYMNIPTSGFAASPQQPHELRDPPATVDSTTNTNSDDNSTSCATSALIATATHSTHSTNSALPLSQQCIIFSIDATQKVILEQVATVDQKDTAPSTSNHCSLPTSPASIDCTEGVEGTDCVDVPSELDHHNELSLTVRDQSGEEMFFK